MPHPPENAEAGPDRLQAGLVGRGILESRTPWMHEREADAQNLRLTYTLFDFTDRGWPDEHLETLLAATQREGFAGLNVTYPFKQAVIPLLDELSDGVTAVGAVNTVAFREGRRIGFNTDVTGFVSGFRHGLPGLAPGRVLQLGCGGAGAATAHALLGSLGAEQVVLSDPDAARAELLGADIARLYGAARVAITADAAATASEVDGILNATPIGMTKFPGLPIAATAIESRHWVADIVYFPLETALLAAARAKGCRTLDGGGMAVHQAVDAFEIFTGRVADHERVRASFAAFAGRTDRSSAA